MRNYVWMGIVALVVGAVVSCSTEAPVAPEQNALVDDPEWAHLTPPGTPVGGDWRASGLTGANGTIVEGCVTMEFTGGSGSPFSWSEKGMKVESRHGSGTGHIHLTGTELNSHSGCCSTPYRFYREDGGLFDLKSMDVTSFGSSDAADLEGSNGAMRTITGNGPLEFDGDWRGLEFFEWDNFDGSHNVDNVMVCPAGESCEEAVADARDALDAMSGDLASRLGNALLDAVESGNERAIAALERITRLLASFGLVGPDVEDFLLSLVDVCEGEAD